jgi:hypothetical protein
MDITFGVLTRDNQHQIEMIVDSIISQNIEVFEIIIIGDVIDIWKSNTICVINDVDANVSNHITKKKNTIIEKASFSTVVIMKDYVALSDGWYDGMRSFGHFDILMNKIEDCHGRRYLDWIWENPTQGAGRNIPYHIKNHSHMFAPGVFLIAKLYVLKKYKFNEKLIGLCKSSDVCWSKAAMKEFSYSMNINSSCRLLQYHNRFPKFRRSCVCETCKLNE